MRVCLVSLRRCLGLAYFLTVTATASPAVFKSRSRVPHMSLSSDLISTINTLSSSQSSSDVTQMLSVIHQCALEIDSQTSSPALSKSSIACTISRLILPSDYVDSSDSTYALERDANWSTNCQLPAACFVKPKNAVQVAVALKIVSVVGAGFSVRNGGHNPNVGFASIDGSGVLIDLTNLNMLKLSTDHTILQAGGGSKWGDVQSLLDPYQLSAVGGRYLAVGISGLILGGGLPIIPSLYGLACDNVKNFEVVLGDSSIVDANANTNSDLFKVLKGGGNNFGIVTRFDLYTVPLYNIWYKAVTYNASDYRPLLKAVTQVQNNMEADEKAGIIFGAVGGLFQVTYIYGEWTRDPATFQPLSIFTPIATSIPATNGTVLSFSKLESAPEAAANREPFGVTTLVDADLYVEVYERFLQLARYSSHNGTGMGLTIQQFGKAAVAAGVARGTNVLGNDAVEQNWWSALVQWTDPVDAVPSQTALGEMRDFIVSSSTRREEYLSYVFANDGSSSQNVMASYGEDGLAEMGRASIKYDPQQVFQTLQYGGWLVSLA